MRILVVCQYYHPEQFRVNDMCEQLAKDGHSVTVLTGLPNYPTGVINPDYRRCKKRVEVVNGVKVTRSWLIGRGKGTTRLFLNYLSFAISASIKALFLKKDFDLIFVYQLSPVTMAFPGILLKKLTKKPFVLYCFDLWPESIASAGVSTGSIIYKLLLKLCKWIYNVPDEILVSSKRFKEYFRDTLNVKKDLKYLPIYAESMFDFVGKDIHDHTNLVFAGNIGEMQSVETIIYAANELDPATNVHIHIVGDGSSKGKCEKLAKELGLRNVTFYGQHPLSDMPHFYRLADAFLVTLRANNMISYTLPGKVQTYMAAGKPIIGAIDGETNNIIAEAECGISVAAEDFKALARAIESFSQQTSARAIYGINARKYYESHFTKEKFMDTLTPILENLPMELIESV